MSHQTRRPFEAGRINRVQHSYGDAPTVAPLRLSVHEVLGHRDGVLEVQGGDGEGAPGEGNPRRSGTR